VKVLILATAILSPCCAHADDDYPTRPVKVITPFGAGGPTDVYARAIAEELRRSLHQPFIIEVHPGAGMCHDVAEAAFSSTIMAEIYRVTLGTGIDPSHFLDKRPQLRPRPLAISGISQRPRPFADRFAIEVSLGRAANNCSKWVCILVERKSAELKRTLQKSFCPPAPFVIHD
jgi:hypothetical protein